MNNHHEKLLVLCGAMSVISVFTSLVLSATTVPPLVIGAIVGSMVPALIAVCSIGDLLYKFYRKDPIEKNDVKDALLHITATLASAVIGIAYAESSLIAVPNAIGVLLFAGMLTGVAAPIMGYALATAIVRTCEKVSECVAEYCSSESVDKYIMSPVVERLVSKKQECEPVTK